MPRWDATNPTVKIMHAMNSAFSYTENIFCIKVVGLHKHLFMLINLKLTKRESTQKDFKTSLQKTQF